MWFTYYLLSKPQYIIKCIIYLFTGAKCRAQKYDVVIKDQYHRRCIRPQKARSCMKQKVKIHPYKSIKSAPLYMGELSTVL